MRRFFMKHHNTLVLSLPTWRNSNIPSPSDLESGSLMIISVSELSQTRKNSREVVGIARLQFIEKIPYRRLPRGRYIELYREIHGESTSNLML